nr:MAG TPA: major tail protein [Caudoviricetes sp.]
MLNKLFLERTEIKIETDDGDLNFVFPKDYNLTDLTIINGVEIKWSYKSVDEEPNEFDIEIKGLTNTTIAKIELKDNIRLVAGYDTDIGEVASGIITRKEVEKGTLKLKCREVPADFKKLVSAAYAPNTTASTIINDLAIKCGFTVKQCELKNDKVYSIGESILGSGLYEIGQIVKDCDSQITIKNDFIYIYHNEINTEKVIKLSYQSGLLEEPKPQNIEEISYKVEKTKESKGKKGSKKTSKGGKKSGKTATKKASKNSKKSKK